MKFNRREMSCKGERLKWEDCKKRNGQMKGILREERKSSKRLPEGMGSKAWMSSWTIDKSTRSNPSSFNLSKKRRGISIKSRYQLSPHLRVLMIARFWNPRERTNRPNPRSHNSTKNTRRSPSNLQATDPQFRA